MKEFRIDQRPIGVGHPTLIVAELGVNHDGSVKRALELVRMASACGADAIKLQVFKATTLMHPLSAFATYQKEGCADATPTDMLRRYELTSSELRQVVRLAQQLKMIPLATPFSPADVETVKGLDLPAVKIASPDLVNHPLLVQASRLNRPLLLSTGAATMAEVQRTAGWLYGWGASFALLHCISSYPAPTSQANLCWLWELARLFAVPVGYSDHTTDVMAGPLAVAAGATIVERHLTYDRGARGPDHASSSDPAQFTRYVKLVREAEILRGAPGKRVLEIEQDVRRVSRQSLVLRRSLQAGECIREEDLTVQRPGTGIPAETIGEVIGREVTCSVPAGTMLQSDMLRGHITSDAA